MIKRMLMATVLGVAAVAGSLGAAQSADAGIFFRPLAPVRRAARVVLPPYPVAHRVMSPVYGPVVGGPVVVGPLYRPAVYASPYYYTPGVSVMVGY